MKTNPFYNYLKKHQSASVQQKKDSHGSDFLLIALESPAAYFTFDYNEISLTFIEHHLSVYAEIKDDIGFASIYHYTVRFDSHTLHVYFNEHGEDINATIEQNDTKKITVLNDLFDDTNDNLMSIRFIFDEKVRMKVQSWHTQHSFMVDGMTKKYQSNLEELKGALFDASEKISENIQSIRNMIKDAEQLLLISYQPQFAKKTLPRLQRYLNIYQQIKQNMQPQGPSTVGIKQTAVATEVATDLPSTISRPDSPVISKRPSSNKPSSKKKKSASTYTVKKDNAIKNFEQAYHTYIEKWTAFTDCSDFAEKIKLFEEIGKEHLIALNSTAVILQDSLIYPNATNERLLLNRSHLDVDLYQEKYKKTGIDLLLACLQTPELLATHGETLKTFTSSLSYTHLEMKIRQQNIPALTFLLEHGSFKINRVLIQPKSKKGSALAPLCAAYKYNNPTLFELLLNNNASCMTLYEGLPLAHTLLQLHANSPFYQAFLTHYRPVLDINARFYKALSIAVNRKLQNEELDETQRATLTRAYTHYEQKSQINAAQMMRLSDTTRSHLTSMRQTIGSDIIQDLRKSSPERDDLSRALDERTNELMRLLQRKHLRTATYMRACEQYCKCAKDLLNNGGGKIYRHLKKEEMEGLIIQAMRELITYVEASITYLNLHTQTQLSKKEKLQRDKAIAILKENERKQRLRETAIATQQAGLAMLNQAFLDMSTANSDSEDGLSIKLLNIWKSTHEDETSSDHSDASETVQDPWAMIPNSKMDDEVFYKNHPPVTFPLNYLPQEDLTKALVVYSGTLLNSLSNSLDQTSPDISSNTRP